MSANNNTNSNHLCEEITDENSLGQETFTEMVSHQVTLTTYAVT